MESNKLNKKYRRVKIKLSPTARKEIEEIETKIRGDMTDEEWEFFKTIRC